MKSTSAAHVSIHPLSPAVCADAAAASNFDRRSATAASGCACAPWAKVTSGAATVNSRDQTHLDALQDLLIIDFSRLSFFGNDSRSPAGTGSGEVKAVTCTPVNNARATRHSRRNARRRVRLGGRFARVFKLFSGAKTLVFASPAPSRSKDVFVAPDNPPDKNVAPDTASEFESDIGEGSTVSVLPEGRE